MSEWDNLCDEWNKIVDASDRLLKEKINEDNIFKSHLIQMLFTGKEVKAVGDKLRERVVYLDGLTDGDVKLITKLQVENGELKHSIATGYCGECDILKEENKELKERLGDYTQHNLELMAEVDDKNTRIKVWKHSSEEQQQKLKTGSRMLDDWEKSTTHPDATLINIRNLKKVFTQNTDYMQKEEQE